MEIAEYFLWSAPVACAVYIIRCHDLVKGLIALSLFSLFVAGLFLIMRAPDVAMTEAAIGAAISTAFFLAALKVTGRQEAAVELDKFPAIIAIFSLVMLMLSIISTMPEYGDANTPPNKHVGKFYTENALEQTGVKNSVTAVLASYRSYDTLGETYVIFTAGLAVILLMPSLKKQTRGRRKAIKKEGK